MKSTTSVSQKLRFLTNKGSRFYAPGQIVRLESESNYTLVHFIDAKPVLVAKVLHEFESILKPMGFVRTHRSHLVNLDHVIGWCTDGGIQLTDNSIAAVSRRKRKEVLKEMKCNTPAA